MSASILILNAGSSSLKFSLFENETPPKLVSRGQIEGLLTQPKFAATDATGRALDQRSWPNGTPLQHRDAIQFLFDWGQQAQLGDHNLVAAGHRVVHGGLKLTQPAIVNDQVLAEMESLIPLAPLHQPHNVTAIRAVADRLPSLPQFACFDTAFHRSQPEIVQQFALPYHLTEAGIQRYGFHGLSYEFIASCLPDIDPAAAAGCTIVAHLGNGASLCALKNGVSVATTMSFTPLDGLPMGTRCGAIDPGVLLYLMDQYSLDARAIEKLLWKESGLLGVSGLSSDMRTLLEQESSHAGAARAIEMFVYRLTREIGSLAAALQGLNALVFTGGIGEHAPAIRGRVCENLRWLGLEIDQNANVAEKSRISTPESRINAWVIPTNEELMIAQHVQRLLSGETA